MSERGVQGCAKNESPPENKHEDENAVSPVGFLQKIQNFTCLQTTSAPNLRRSARKRGGAPVAATVAIEPTFENSTTKAVEKVKKNMRKTRTIFCVTQLYLWRQRDGTQRRHFCDKHRLGNVLHTRVFLKTLVSEDRNFPQFSACSSPEDLKHRRNTNATIFVDN
jgi:hypothetical protein